MDRFAEHRSRLGRAIRKHFGGLRNRVFDTATETDFSKLLDLHGITNTTSVYRQRPLDNFRGQPRHFKATGTKFFKFSRSYNRLY